MAKAVQAVTISSTRLYIFSASRASHSVLPGGPTRGLNVWYLKQYRLLDTVQHP